jgi:hypothetical protein
MQHFSKVSWEELVPVLEERDLKRYFRIFSARFLVEISREAEENVLVDERDGILSTTLK